MISNLQNFLRALIDGTLYRSYIRKDRLFSQVHIKTCNKNWQLQWKKTPPVFQRHVGK